VQEEGKKYFSSFVFHTPGKIHFLPGVFFSCAFFILRLNNIQERKPDPLAHFYFFDC